MSVESIKSQKFSKSSDSWMFAIMLVELFSQGNNGVELNKQNKYCAILLGAPPYGELTAVQVALAVINDDLRPQRPVKKTF